MKHRTSGKKFGRNRQRRRALLVGLTRSLIRSGRITTTEERAKALQSFVQKLFTVAQRETLEGRRSIQRILQNSEDTKNVLSITAAVTPSNGFTRVTKVFIRKGDAARMAEIRLTSADVMESPPASPVSTTKGAKLK